MRVLIVASIPFESMRRRQQQVALGLAARGVEVLYLNPPRPFRSLIDPDRFELQEIPLDQVSEGIGRDQSAAGPGRSAAPDAGEVTGQKLQVAGVRIQTVVSGLHVADKGIAMAAMGRWGWATRSGWKRWASQVQKVIAALSGGDQVDGAEQSGAGEQSGTGGPSDASGPSGGKERIDSRSFSFHPDVAIVYHPALIAPLRKVYSGPIVFDCLDDFPSLAHSRSIAAAYEDALTNGVPLTDGMIAVNRYLLESWGRLLRPDVPRTVIEHGVDLSLFRPPDTQRTAAVRSALEVAPDLKMICYLGRFDARISYEDLQTMMSLNEDTIFLFVGEVGSEGRAIFQRLPARRIMPVGPIRPDQAADIVAASNALIFPFRREPHLESVRGLKLYEYFATGRPVVASFRRTLKSFRELLYLYTTREELEEAFRTALKEPADAPVTEERVRVARAAGWDRRVEEIEAFLRSIVPGA